MTNEQSFISSEDTVVRNLQIRKRARAWHRANFFGDILARKNGNDARRLQCFARVNRTDPCVRIQRTYKGDVQNVWQFNVVNIMCQTFDQPGIFGSLYSLSNILTHYASKESHLRLVAGLCRPLRSVDKSAV